MTWEGYYIYVLKISVVFYYKLMFNTAMDKVQNLNRIKGNRELGKLMSLLVVRSYSSFIFGIIPSA